MKKLACLLVIGSLILSGCGRISANLNYEPVTEAVFHGADTFTDSLGTEMTLDSPKRVAALSGSLAEIWTLAGGELACITQDVFDEKRLDLPDGIANAGHLKNPSTETIIKADVDFAILSSNLSGQKEIADTLRSAGITVACFDVETFEDYLHVLKIFTGITGRSDLYEKNGAEIGQEIQSIISDCKNYPSPKVLLIRAYSTGAKVKNSFNNMTGVMLKDLGCINIADRDSSVFEDLSMEKIIKADPDFIFVTTMGDDDKALSAFAENLQSNPAWGTLRAVQSDRFEVLPKDLFHLKPNHRWAKSYRILANILYGEK